MQVSIIIPIFNAQPFLERTMAAALAAGTQVQGGFEIIAVDNGSTDASPHILEAVANQNPNVVRILSCPGRGASIARNYGLAHSKGKWLQFLDADDTLHPDKIAHQLAVAGQADWVVGAYRHLYSDGSTEDSLPHPDLWRGLFYDYRTGCTHSNLIRREALEAIGGWDESLVSNQDPDLCFRLLQARTDYTLDNNVLSYYHHHDSPIRITGSDPALRYVLRLQLLSQARHYLESAQPSYWQLNEGYFLGAILRVLRQLATYDLEAACAGYQKHFLGTNTLDSNLKLELVSQYTRLYPYLGFRNVERLRLALANVIPEELKRILKS